MNYPKFEVTILGCGSATPGAGRHPSSQALSHSQNVFLIDCGEGTQDRLKSFGVKWNRIDQIFISHLHGDHIFGLPGLLSTFHLNHRERKLQIISPLGLKEPLLALLNAGGEPLSFEIEWIELNHSAALKVWENDRLEVVAVALNHRISTYGFVFHEKEHLRKIRVHELSKFPILSHSQLKLLKLGHEVFLDDGTFVDFKIVTEKVLEKRSYAYWSDTRFIPDLASVLKDVTVLFHEATFLHQLHEKAVKTYHSTALEAAEMAKLCQVDSLLLGHFSSRYATVDLHEQEAQQIFLKTKAVFEGQVYPISKKND